MEQIVYWLAIWTGVMLMAFALMVATRMAAGLRRRRRAERPIERSVAPILKFNLRRHFDWRLKTAAGQGLESMTPGGTACYRLREALESHDATTRASEALDKLEAKAGDGNPRRAGTRSRRRMRI